MATKTNSQRLIEARKKREEESKNSSSTGSTLRNSDKLRKTKLERTIGLDTFDSDLANTNSALSSVLSGWQTEETMVNTRSTVENMYKRATDYQNYISKYQPDAQSNVGEISEYYKSLLDSWDNIAGTYGQYKDADSYTRETAKLKELQSMTKDELASYLKGDNPIAYTTYGGQDITWKGLYDEKEHAELATSPKGKQGWEKYLADELTASQEKKEEEEGKSFWDKLGGYLGGVSDTTLPSATMSQVVNEKREDTSYMKPTNDWSREEKNIFGAYYLEDPEKAYEYATSVNNQKNIGKEEEQKQKVADSATSGFWAGAGHTLGSVASAPLGLADYLADLTDMASGRPIMSDGVLSPFEYSQEVQGSIGNKLNEVSGTINENVPVLGGKGLGDLYGVGTSIAQSALSGYALGGVGTMISYFGQGASAGIDEALSRGATDEQAMLYGVLVGAGEGISEKIGVDNMFKLGSADTVKGFIKNVLKQAGSEGIEEGISSIISEVSDRLVMQDKSVFENAVRTYMTQGMSEEEAKKKAWSDTFNSIAFDAVAGAVSGGTHGLIQTAVQSGSENRMNKKVGSVIRENETVGDLKKLASDLGGDVYQKYIELLESGKISDAQLGKFHKEVESDTQRRFQSEEDNVIFRPIADIANELGDSKNSGLIASAIKKKEYKQKLTSEEKAVLKTETAQGVLERIKKDGGIEIYSNSYYDTALRNKRRADSIITPKTVEEKAVASATKEAKTQAQETQTRVNEMVQAEGREDISFYSESMEQAKAEAFNTIYDGKTDLESYADSFELAYTYGKNKIGVSEALKHKGVLTEAQALKAYEAGNVGRAIEKQKIVDDINKQYSGKTFVKGKFDDSIIDYTGNAEGKVSWKELGASRQNAIKLVKAFAEVTGVNVEIISSTVNEKGEREGEHGKYVHSTNTIYIDAYAGSMDASTLNDAIIPTVSHEVTHWMKAKAPAMYQKMQDYVLETLTLDGKMTLNEMIAKQKYDMKRNNIKRNRPDIKVTDEDAIDELVARACEDMLANSDKVRKMLAKMSKTEQDSFIAKVKETFENIMNWVNDLLKQYKSNSKEAELLRQYKERMKELSKMWDDALTEAIQTNQSMAQMKAEGSTNKQINEALSGNGISKDGTTIIGENAMQMSERTYAEGGRDFLENWLNEKVEAGEMDGYDAENIIIQTDLLYDLMQEIKEGNELPEYAKWAETDATYNEDGQQVTVIVKNGDYTMNLDSSQVCKKRTALNAVLNAMVQSNELSAYTLTEKDVAILNNIIKKHDFEIACALCFVDSKRYRVGDWANSFCEGTHTKKENKYGFNEMVRSLVPEGSDIQIDEYNFTGRKFKNPKKNLLKNAPESKLDFTLIDKIMAENASNTAQYRYAKAIKENKELRSILNPSEIISSIGLDNLRVKNMKLYSLVNGHQGTAKPKFAHDSVAFGNDILKATSWTADKAKYVGGVRLQSFSDFMANMVFDYVQMISELSARELTSHAYTKEPLFVRLFGLTGMKINMSLVPRVALTDEQKARFAKLSDKKKKTDAEYLEAKEHAGLVLDKNGEWQYAWEDETFPYDVAMDIMADARYTKNCGTIAVGISNMHIEKLLADDRISMVIPYHKSGLNHTVAIMRNIDLYNDYTDYQNTRGTNGKKLDGVPDFDFYGDLYGKDGKEGTHDPRQTAENYKKWCAENGYIPKFDQFAKNPNYYKLLIDFTVYDINDNMKYTEQGAVKPIYPAKEEFKELIVKGVVKNGVTYGGLEQSQNTSNKLKAETDTIIKEFKEALANEYGEDVLGTQYSDRDQNWTLKEYSEKQLENWKDSKRIVVYENDAQLMDFVDEAVSSGTFNKKMYFGMVSDELADEMSNRFNVDVHDFNVSLSGNETRKILKDHGDEAKEAPRGQRVVQKEDFAHIPYVMEKPTEIEYGGLYNGKPLYNFRRDGYTVAGVVSDKHLDLFVQTMYVSKKNRSLATATDEQASVNTSETTSGTASTDSIAQESTGNQDQFSDRDYTSVYELMGEKDTLDEENRKLKADIEKLKATIGSEDVKITRFRSLADYLKKHAGSNYSRETLGDALKELYTYIQTTDDLKWYNVMAKAEEIANDMMQLNVPVNYFREVMNDIRQDKVSLSAEQMAEAEKLYGNYGNLHKALFGRVNLTKGGRPLEEQWKDWAKAYPMVFKADISATDMVKELRDIVDALKNTSAVMGEYERQEAIRHLGMEIYNQFWNIASDTSEAVRKERVAHREMMEEMRKNYEKRQAEKTLHPVGEVALKYEKLLKDTIKRDRAEMKRIRELGNKRMEEYKERAEVKATIQKITKNALTLNEWFVKNSKDKHIPEEMKGAVVQLITAIDFSSKQMLGIGGAQERRNQPTGNDLRLAKALSRLYEVADEMQRGRVDSKGNEVLFMELDLPDSTVDVLKKLSKTSLVLNQMTLEQLQALDVVVSTFKKAIITANKNFVLAQNETRERVANRLIYDADSLSKKNTDNMATNFLEYANTTPYYMLKRLGRVGEQIFSALMDAQEQLVFLEEEIINFVKKTVDGKKIKQWSEEIHEIKILDAERSTEDNPKYKTIKMTTAQIMSLYALEKRESAKLHLAGGGIRIADIKDGLKTITDEGSSLAKSELHSIIGRLTNEQKRVADALQKYMSDTGAEWGNKVTMARWDIKQFGEENYFPMVTVKVDGDLDNIGRKDNSIYRLLNMSFTKPLTDYANNQLVIFDIFDVFAEHMTDMAKYTTHALPLLDTMKILGYNRKDFFVDEDGKKSVRHTTISTAKSIRRAFGDNGYRYIINLLKDLNGVEVTPRDEALTKTMMANYKISAVGGNLRVALLQGSAFIKAGLVMNPKYLIKSLATNGLKGIEKAMKHSGIALWKSKGHYDLNIGRSVASEIKQDENWMDKVREWSLKGAEWGDKITWGYLWNASELWARENTPYSYNSAEFNKAVADKLREIIVKTQVVDSTLTRSQMMRGKSAMVQTLTAFMSESTMTYNMLSDAFFEWSLDARKEGHSYKSTFSKHGRKFATTASVYALTAFATALAGGFVDAVRDDDEEKEFDEKYIEHLLEALGDNVNVFANLPIFKDIVSIAQGYSPSRFDEQSFVNLFSGIRQWMKVAEGEGNVYKATYKTLQGMSQLTGLPVSNMMRDVVAMWNTTIGEMYPHLKIEQ